MCMGPHIGGSPIEHDAQRFEGFDADRTGYF